MRCSKCQGSGEIMGNGMMFKQCDCDDGRVREVQPIQIDKRSKAYREAITRLMETSDCTREEAVIMFESEFNKIA